MSTTYEERYYAERYRPTDRRDAVWREIVDYLQHRFFARVTTVLDLAAGYCSFINHVAAPQRHALDISGSAEKFAAPGVIAHTRSCTDLSPFLDGSVDVVFASNLFEHLERADLEQTLAEVRRILAPRGRLIVMQPNFRYAYREYFDDYTHLQIFTDRSLADLFAVCGLPPIHVQPRFMPFSFGSGMPAHPLLVRLYLRSPWKFKAGQMLIVAGHEAEARSIDDA
jgi:SAM-dependent methyltransferase